MPPPRRTLDADADAVLRELYSPERVSDALFQQNPLLGMIDRAAQADIGRQQEALSQHWGQQQAQLSQFQQQPFMRDPTEAPVDALSRLVETGAVSREQAIRMLERRMDAGMSAIMGGVNESVYRDPLAGTRPAPANNRHDRKREANAPPVVRRSRWEMIAGDWLGGD